MKSPKRQASNRRREKDREIARLRGALAAERSHSAKLEREITKLKQELKDQAHPTHPARRMKRRGKNKRKEDRLLDEANRHARYYRKRSFLRYLFDAVKESAVAQIITKFLRYLKRFQLMQTVIPILLAAGAVATVTLVSPLATMILAASIVIPTIFILLRFRHANRVLRRELNDRCIRVMIPSKKGAMEPHSFFIRNARSMAADPKVTVIVVTPYLLSKKGLGGRGLFFTARKEAETLYLVRPHYFFTFRRRVLDRLNTEVTMIF